MPASTDACMHACMCFSVNLGGLQALSRNMNGQIVFVSHCWSAPTGWAGSPRCETTRLGFGQRFQCPSGRKNHGPCNGSLVPPYLRCALGLLLRSKEEDVAEWLDILQNAAQNTISEAKDVEGPVARIPCCHFGADLGLS